MSGKRYQLWMRLRFYKPGNTHDAWQIMEWRIIDTHAADLRAQQSEVLADGYSFYGQSDDSSEAEKFAREMQEGQQ